MNVGTGRTLAAAILALGLCRAATADTPAAAETKALDKSLVATLRDVHDRGADLYNLSKDYLGSYRLYEGALLTVKPLLAHRPAVQKTIVEGLSAAAADPDAARKAFLLHETIEKVRMELKGVTAPKPPVVTPTPKPKETTPTPKPKETTPTPKPKETTPAPKPKETTPTPKPKEPPPPVKGGASVSGKVSLSGKALPDGVVTFVSLDKKAPKVATAKIKGDGTYTVKDLPAGKYAVTVAAETGGMAVIPAKFATTDTSGLTFEMKAETTTFDLELK